MRAEALVESFVKAVNQDPKLLKECQAALDGSKNAKRFVALAAKHGFKFSESAANSYFRKNLLSAPSSTALSAKEVQYPVGAKVMKEPESALRNGPNAPSNEFQKDATVDGIRILSDTA